MTNDPNDQRSDQARFGIWPTMLNDTPPQRPTKPVPLGRGATIILSAILTLVVAAIAVIVIVFVTH